MSEPRTATLTGTITWEDGSAFDGYILLGLALPENDLGQWPVASAEGIHPAQRLPIFTFIPVRGGVIDQQTKVIFNADITPPNTQYVAYWYDRNKRRVFPLLANPSFFTISTNPHAISIPFIDMPVPTIVAPQPEETGV